MKIKEIFKKYCYSTREKRTIIFQIYIYIYIYIYIMEHYKPFNLLNDSTVPKFVKRKWIEVNDLSGDQHSTNKNLRLKSPML